MQHIIVTRFNLVFENWLADKNNNPILTEEWLSERFELFETYCFPSVKNQTNQNFLWLVYFDISTPEKYINIIKGLQDSYNNFIPQFIDGSKNFERELIHYVNKELLSNEYILTTRIDNDDSIHKDFVKTIQDLAQPVHKFIIDVRKGFQMILINDLEEFRVCEKKFNPFISLVQKREKFESIFRRQHTEWEKETNIVIFNKIPLWIQIIHGRNKLNKVNRHNRLIYNISLDEFGIRKSLKHRSWLYVKVYNSLMNIFEIIKNR